MKSESITRRDVLKSTAAATAGLALASEAKAKTHEGTINCGFIGIGGRGRADLSGMLKCKNIKVVSLCDITPANLERAVKMVKDAQGHEPDRYDRGPEDYKRMLEREDLHAVGMATPCDWHAAMFRDAIKAGKHIYGEKPMGLNNKDLDEIIALAEKNKNVIVQLGFQWMSHDRFLEAADRIHAGEFGNLVEGRWARHNSAKPLRGWFSIRKRSGDWMIEQACHEINVLNWITKAHPLQAFAIGRRDLWTKTEPNRDVTDYYAAVLEYPKDFIVHFAHDWNSPKGFNTGMEMTVVGDVGAVDIWRGKVAYRDEKRETKPLKAFKGNDTDAHWRTFINAIRTGKQPLAGPHYGRLASQVGLLIRRAIDLKKAVTWDDMLKHC